MKNPEPLRVDLETGATTALVYSAPEPDVPALVLGHGAGAGQQSGFMVQYAAGLAGLGVTTITFNFPYTEQHRRIPDRAPTLLSCYRHVIGAVIGHVKAAQDTLFIGGKSMGGRMATMLAASDRELPVHGLVLLGYPLHPPGRPDQRRDAHLPDIHRPMLFVQGSRDTFGLPAELKPVLDRLSPLPTLHVVEGGDHSFKLAGRGAAAQSDTHAGIQRRIVDWMRSVTASR